MLQSPFWSVVPFVLGGVGYWNVLNDAAGDDTDPAFHFGAGVKVNVSSHVALRADVRDTITNPDELPAAIAHNLDLSQRRAAAVKTLFVGKGIDPHRIQSRGAGPEEPLESNGTPAGRQKNHRIEFKIIEP